MELEIHLKDGRTVSVACDTYKEETEKDATRRWLRIYRGDERIGQYDLDEIVGYHEYRRPPPQRGR